MFCPNCGCEAPEYAHFCMHCGTPLNGAPAEERGGTQHFDFPMHTTCDRASVMLNDWLSAHAVRITGARFVLDTELLAGTLVPTLTACEVDWLPEEGAEHYRFGLMMDSRADLGLNRARGQKRLIRGFEHWLREHPACEVAGRQDCQLSVGWVTAWVTVFFFR